MSRYAQQNQTKRNIRAFRGNTTGLKSNTMLNYSTTAKIRHDTMNLRTFFRQSTCLYRNEHTLLSPNQRRSTIQQLYRLIDRRIIVIVH
jgi:hypothetical protein